MFSSTIFVAVTMTSPAIEMNHSHFRVVRQSAGLFLSEVLEGSSFNKVVEIYNPTTSAIDLSGYMIWATANQRSQYYIPFGDGASIASGDTYTMCNARIGSDWANRCDHRTSQLGHNGDDILRLIEGDSDGNTVLDKFGIEGARTTWSICGVSRASQNRGLIRKPEIVSGTTNWDASRGTNADNCQWIVDSRDNHRNTDVHDCRLPVLTTPRPTASPTPSVAPTSSRPSQAPTTSAPTLPPFPATTPVPGARTLILSEVIEGSSYNKVIEIFNPANDPVELGRYQIRQMFNGQAEAEFFLTLPSVMIQPGATFTVCNPRAHDSFLEACDMTDRVDHNGNDAIFLVYGREDDYVIIDSFGTEAGGSRGPWDVCGQSRVTANAGIRRKPGVARGNTDWTSSAGTTADDCEWIVLRGGNDAAYTGEHASDFPHVLTVSPTPMPTVSPTTLMPTPMPTMPPTTSMPTVSPTTPVPTVSPTGGGTNQASGASRDAGDSDDDLLVIIIIIAVALVLLVLIAGIFMIQKNRAKAATTARAEGPFENPIYGGEQQLKFEVTDSGTDGNTGYMDVG